MLYLLDTTAFINYFDFFFKKGNKLNSQINKDINICFNKYNYKHRISIPSVVFIEVYDNFLKSQEKRAEFYNTVFHPLKENEMIEIKPIEKGVLEEFTKIPYRLEMHDKIIYSSAKEINATLITNDPSILECNKLAGEPIRIVF